MVGSVSHCKINKNPPDLPYPIMSIFSFDKPMGLEKTHRLIPILSIPLMLLAGLILYQSKEKQGRATSILALVNDYD